MCEGIDFLYKLFVFELIFSVVLDTIVEGFGDGEEVEILDEPVDGLFVVVVDGLPSF